MEVFCARKLAEELVARAKSGADFVALCKENDDGDSTLRNGVGIGRKRGEIQPALIEPFLFRMPVGEVGPIVEVTNGYHVFLALIGNRNEHLAGLLDSVLGEARRLRAEVGGADRARLDEYLEVVRGLEERLARAAAPGRSDWSPRAAVSGEGSG